MNWLNLYGLVLMAPNIIFAVKCKGRFENFWRNKAAALRGLCGREPHERQEAEKGASRRDVHVWL